MMIALTPLLRSSGRTAINNRSTALFLCSACKTRIHPNGNSFPYLDVFLGIGLFILGVGLSYLMVLYTRKKNKEKNKKASLSIKDLCNTYATATFEDFEFVAEIECVDNKTKEDEKVL